MSVAIGSTFVLYVNNHTHTLFLSLSHTHTHSHTHKMHLFIFTHLCSLDKNDNWEYAAVAEPSSLISTDSARFVVVLILV